MLPKLLKYLSIALTGIGILFAAMTVTDTFTFVKGLLGSGQEAGVNVSYGAIVTFYPETGKPVAVKAEVADTGEKISAGLMFRESLGQDEGMLFIFSDSAPRNFWMKNTLIPLDMIFISEDLKVVKIHHAIPCASDPCMVYHSEAPAKYVLEVKGNLTITEGIAEGNIGVIAT